MSKTDIGLLVIGGLAIWLLLGKAGARPTTRQPSLDRVPLRIQPILDAPNATAPPVYQPPTVRQEPLSPFGITEPVLPHVALPMPAPVNNVSVQPIRVERISPTQTIEYFAPLPPPPPPIPAIESQAFHVGERVFVISVGKLANITGVGLAGDGRYNYAVQFDNNDASTHLAYDFQRVF